MTADRDNKDKAQVMQLWEGYPDLTICIPPDYTIQKQEGPDFIVHYMLPSKPNNPSMGVYFGDHPKLFGSKAKNTTVIPGSDLILGQRVKWINWLDEELSRNEYHTETIISEAFQAEECHDPGIKIHIFITGPDPEGVDSLRTTTTSLRIAANKEQHKIVGL